MSRKKYFFLTYCPLMVPKSSLNVRVNGFFFLSGSDWICFPFFSPIHMRKKFSFCTYQHLKIKSWGEGEEITMPYTPLSFCLINVNFVLKFQIYQKKNSNFLLLNFFFSSAFVYKSRFSLPTISDELIEGNFFCESTFKSIW